MNSRIMGAWAFRLCMGGALGWMCSLSTRTEYQLLIAAGCLAGIAISKDRRRKTPSHLRFWRTLFLTALAISAIAPPFGLRFTFGMVLASFIFLPSDELESLLARNSDPGSDV